MAQAKMKKKRSQAPIALVYFATMLVFLVVIGTVVLALFNKYDFLNTKDKTVNTAEGYTADDCMTTLYAHVNTKGVLCEAMLVRFAPTSQEIVIVPISPYVYDETNSETLREVHKAGGIVELEKSVSDTFGVEIDRYIAVTNDAVNDACDMLGGYTYTPIEDLYYLSEDGDDNDISIKKGQAIDLTGQQIRLILAYPVFSEGKMGNVKFMSEAFVSMLNTAFKNTEMTTNNLDILYNITVADAETDFTSEDFKAQKSIILEMLEKGCQPVHSLVPTGNWDDEQTQFTVSSAFKEELAKAFAVSFTQYKGETTSQSSSAVDE